MKAFVEEAAQWCRGKNRIIRAPLIGYFTYVLVRHVFDPRYTSIIGGLNLGIHELGHLAFGFLGQTISVAGGTIAQLAVPVFAAFNFYRQRDFFAIALSFGWLSTSLFNVATYVGDARRLELPLVGIGGIPGCHDWEYLLGTMNALQYDAAIAGCIRAAAVLSMLVCLIAGAWLLQKMGAPADPAG